MCVRIRGPACRSGATFCAAIENEDRRYDAPNRRREPLLRRAPQRPALPPLSRRSARGAAALPGRQPCSRDHGDGPRGRSEASVAHSRLDVPHRPSSGAASGSSVPAPNGLASTRQTSSLETATISQRDSPTLPASSAISALAKPGACRSLVARVQRPGAAAHRPLPMADLEISAGESNAHMRNRSPSSQSSAVG